MLESPKIDSTIKLMQPVLDSVNVVKNKSIILVVGGSGDGKSTLINYLHGCAYVEHRKSLGKSIAKLKSDSPKEICKVGKNLAHSETLYPKALEIQFADNSFVYCDLPGFFETRGEAERICAAAAPNILSRYAESIKGIVWVINLDHFNTNKASSIKEMLSYFLKISKNTPELIANSLTMVITHSSSDTQKKGILKALHKTVESINDPHEKALLQVILKALNENPEKIVISNVFDEGESRIKISEAVSFLVPQPTEAFNFSCYTDAQHAFNQHLIGAADNYLESTNELIFLSKKHDEISSKINEKRQEGESLGFSENECADTLIELDKKLEELELFSKNCEEIIDDIEKSEKYIKIDEIKTVKKDPQMEQKESLIGKFPSGIESACGDSGEARNNASSFKNQMIQAGCTRFGGYDEGTGKRAKFVVEAYRSELVPVKGMTHEQSLSYLADFPVKVEYKNTSGVSIKPGTEKTDKGYEATLVYDAGLGLDVSVNILALQKYSPEGKTKIAENKLKKEKSNTEIKLLQQRRSQLQKIQGEMEELQKEEKTILDRKNGIEKELTDRKDFFKSVYTISNILELSQSESSIRDFVTCFENRVSNNGEQKENLVVEKKTADKNIFPMRGNHSPQLFQSNQIIPPNNLFSQTSEKTIEEISAFNP